MLSDPAALEDAVLQQVSLREASGGVFKETLETLFEGRASKDTLLAALNRPHEFKLHFRGAITNGLSVADLREICTQIAVYCGVPAGIDAFRLAREVFNEQGIDISTIDVKTDLED